MISIQERRRSMKVNNIVLEELRYIIKNDHHNNMSDFARETGIDKSYISELLSDKRGIGVIFIEKMNKYCDRKKRKRINFF